MVERKIGCSLAPEFKNKYTMKTLKDLFELINKETELNAGMMQQNVFDINTRYKWCSMWKVYGNDVKDEEVFNSKSIKTPEELQEVYWTIYNNSRQQY